MTATKKSMRLTQPAVYEFHKAYLALYRRVSLVCLTAISRKDSSLVHQWTVPGGNTRR
jgi:hypothetical protein